MPASGKDSNLQPITLSACVIQTSSRRVDTQVVDLCGAECASVIWSARDTSPTFWTADTTVLCYSWDG